VIQDQTKLSSVFVLGLFGEVYVARKEAVNDYVVSQVLNVLKSRSVDKNIKV